MNRVRAEAGYTLIEVLIALTVFSIISVGFYQVMVQSVRGSEQSRDVAEISEEARAGFNRMLRDIREADSLDAASSTSFQLWVDYDADSARDYASDEVVVYTFDESAGTVTLASLDSGGSVQTSATLMDGVENDASDTDVFRYTSNRLEYDWSPVDGVTTWEEIDTPQSGVNGIGDRDGTLDVAELSYLSNIIIKFNVQVGDSQTEFLGEGQLRNRRFSV
ncbi:MAG TPA: prepilin-type N-terminal cleavage/methylation domain-containing protein [Actinomycetota bacterium]|nr:prepilin-type N-terminal cleavage/methylation domain-containing protein [Actinomycetota bacterium]